MTDSRTKKPIVAIGLLVSFALWVLTLSAQARAGEVHFDPESPAGKEYALPLQQARNEAIGGGGGGETGGSGQTAPLFGVGVGGGSGSGGNAGGGQAHGGETGSRGTGAEGQRQPGSRQAQEAGGRPAATVALVDADHGYSLGAGLPLFVALLLSGVVIGLGLRAWGRGRPATG